MIPHLRTFSLSGQVTIRSLITIGGDDLHPSLQQLLYVSVQNLDSSASKYWAYRDMLSSSLHRFIQMNREGPTNADVEGGVFARRNEQRFCSLEKRTPLFSLLGNALWAFHADDGGLVLITFSFIRQLCLSYLRKSLPAAQVVSLLVAEANRWSMSDSGFGTVLSLIVTTIQKVVHRIPPSQHFPSCGDLHGSLNCSAILFLEKIGYITLMWAVLGILHLCIGGWDPRAH